MLAYDGSIVYEGLCLAICTRGIYAALLISKYESWAANQILWCMHFLIRAVSYGVFASPCGAMFIHIIMPQT